jgi:hypothetical protein
MSDSGGGGGGMSRGGMSSGGKSSGGMSSGGISAGVPGAEATSGISVVGAPSCSGVMSFGSGVIASSSRSPCADSHGGSAGLVSRW